MTNPVVSPFPSASGRLSLVDADSQKLTDGDLVTIKLSGMHPNTYYELVECYAPSKSVMLCDDTNWDDTTTDGHGTTIDDSFWISDEIDVGDGTYLCSELHSCLLAALSLKGTVELTLPVSISG